MGAYDEAYKLSIEKPEEFWAEAAKKVHWYNEWDKVLDDSGGHYKWFVGGCMNTCYNALDFHIHNGRGDQLALIYDSPVTDTKQKYTYKQLRDRVAKTAGILVSKGVVKGDRVVIYMPMIAEAVIAMLACARIGAIHSVVFGGFAAHELAMRIEDAKPRVIITASCGIEISKIIEYKPILDEAIKNPSTNRQPALCGNARNIKQICFRGGMWIGRLRRRRLSQLSQCQFWRLTRFTSSTPQARQARQRASSAQTAGIRWR